MRSATVALALALAASLPPGGTFIDDDGNTHEGAIEAIAAKGITRGCNPPANNRYCPDQLVTRGEMAAFLDRALALEPTDDDFFADDDGHIFEPSINRLAAVEVTRGCNPPRNDRFCPDSAMTRGEMAAMLTRAFGYPHASEDRFTDAVGHQFEDAINRLAAADVTRGCNPNANDRYCPDDFVTRDQMASFLSRALELTPITPPPRPNPAVAVVPREGWDARPALVHLMKPHTPSRLTIHHAGTQTGTTGPGQFQGWQNWHLNGHGWGDLAYHVIIGMDGVVYEGRNISFEGDTDTSYDTQGHFLVVVEGNFDHDRPTTDQVDSLAAVLAWAAEEFGISPSTISGHRDHAATACPGAHLYALIQSGQLTQLVEDLIDSGGVDLVWP